MKFSIFAVAAILSTGAHAQEPCSVCPGGINVAANTPTVGGNTCRTIQADAARYDASSSTCNSIKFYEGLCCGGTTESTVSAVEETTAAAAAAVVTTEAPGTTEAPATDATTCSPCPNGITVPPGTITEGTRICGNIQSDAAMFGADDIICSVIKAFESTCCPDVPATEAAATTPAAVAGSTTADAVADSTDAAIVSSTVAVSSTQAVFAPTTAVSGSSCVVCPGGITAPANVPTVPGKTCADLLPDAAQQEAGDGICELIQQSEGTCCPVGDFVACSVCAGGLTASGATLLVGDITCDDIIADAAEVSESSDVCTQVKGFENTCCPAVIASTTEATTTPAAATTTVTAAEAGTSTAAASVSSTTASFDYDLNMTKTPTKAPTPTIATMAPVGNENLPLSNSTTISGFNELYDPSAGFSVSVMPRFALSSIVIAGVYAMLS